MSTEICMIVAANYNDVIGIDNKLPWHITEDLKYFRATTLGHPVVMGRKTFESIGKPLPARANYVLSRSSEAIPGVTVINAPERLQSDTGKVFIIGGSEVYKAYQEMIDTIYLTRINLPVPGDAFLPFNVTCPDWRLVDSNPITTERGVDVDFQIWKRNIP